MRVLAFVAPTLFVVLWSTGFVGARLTMPYAEPMTFLAVRFLAAAILLALIALIMRPTWSARPLDYVHDSIAGLLIQAAYLGGTFFAIRLGLEAGASALIVGIQPVLTAILAGPLLGEAVAVRKWIGLALGVTGVVLVIVEKLGGGLGTPLSVFFAIIALVSISTGTLYQKKYCSDRPILPNMIVQYIAAGLALAVLALVFETQTVVLSADLIIGFVWLTVVLSCLVICLLYWLLQRGAATNVASLFFLVPPVAAVFGWLLFGETLGPLAIAGMALVGLAVALVNLAPRQTPPAAGGD